MPIFADRLGIEHSEKIIMFWLYDFVDILRSQLKETGPRSAVGNVSGYIREADCRSRGREFDPGPVPYFRGD